MTLPRDSLTDRFARRAARVARERPRVSAADARIALALAAVVAMGPLLTIVGADLIRAGVEAEARALEAQFRTRMAPAEARRDAAAVLRDSVRQPALATTLERLARVLPDDARLVSAARGADGLLLVEIAASDPDLLRGALRRDPVLAAMRESGQRRTGDARVVVTLRSRA